MNSLACDIGNSFVKFGFFKDNHLIMVMNVKTKDLSKDKRYFFFLDKVKDVIIASVVPKAKKILIREIKNFNKKINIYSLSDLEIDFDYSLYEKNKLGEDRISSCYYVYKFYKKNGIVCDLGSATTFSCVKKEGIFIGGLILPGILTSYFYLAQIKKIVKDNFIFDKEIEVKALSPKTAVLEGIKFFVLEGLSFLIKKYKNKVGKDFKVFLTGGLSFLFYPYLKGIDYFEPYLGLKGLNLILKEVLWG
ncbi:MAG: type III pantothenate kinase [candidate division WOR-3 bacterium]|nr:type III pantothenate kinase [candidate division WOR-3 bacterium]MCX7836667.1 type III pantothenate kinase [candidate division WOR-3 bacterium]MDW8113692.1 type III pantothenate kinase [candidate division WOR-3 bacterium]